MKKTVSQLWEHYRAKVMSPKAPHVQVHECQLAFYAGSAAMVREMVKIGEPSVTEDEAVQTIQKFIDELDSFVQLIRDESSVG